MNVPKLRDWQVKADNQVINNKRNVVAVFTGAGKGTLALHMIKKRLLQGKRCLFLVHSLSILNDTIAKASDMGFKFGIIQGNNTRDIDEPFIIASTLSLIKKSNHFDFICWDEAHHIYSAMFKYIENNPSAEIVGFTATPFNPKMSSIFNHVISPVTANQLTNDGVLVPLRLKMATRIDISNVGLKGGEFIDTDIEREGKKILGDTVKFWLSNASNRKTIIFASTISHAESIADAFLKFNIQAGTYCANTSETVRAELIRRFKDPSDNLMILTTVSALSTGFDAPIASCIISCRPLSKSFTSFVQCVGRILRCYPDKQDALYIDCDGNFDRFGEEYIHLFNNGVESLAKSSKLDKINRHKKKSKKNDSKECPQCQSKLIIADKCFACGHVFIKPIAKLNHITENVQLIDKLIGDTQAVNKNRFIWEMCCKQAEGSKNPLWRAKFLYRDIVSRMPPDNWEFKPSQTITPKFRGYVQRQTIKYLKGKQKWS